MGSPASEAVQRDRAALVVLYEATDGGNWDDNTNWLSDAPLGDWYGVTTDADGRIMELALAGNNLTGSLPAELGSLGNLQVLELAGNSLDGALPAAWDHLVSLEVLELAGKPPERATADRVEPPAASGRAGPLPQQPECRTASGMGPAGQPRGAEPLRQQPDRGHCRRSGAGWTTSRC